MSSIPNILGSFTPITLGEMDSVALLNRTDTKFVLAAAQLPELLEILKPHYRSLEVEGARASAYQTLYLDTDADFFYFQHHNERPRRIKVRYRCYLESGISFLEIKSC